MLHSRRFIGLLKEIPPAIGIIKKILLRAL